MEPSNRSDPSRRIRKKYRRANEDAQDDLIEPDPAGAYPQQACFEHDPVGAAALPSPPSSPPSESALARAALPSPPSLVLNHPPVCADQSRVSPLDSGEDVPSASDSSGRHGADNDDRQNSGQGAVVPQHSSSDDDWDGDPFLTDIHGNLTTWRLSDMEAALEKHLEDEASKPKVEEKNYSKEEILKRNDDCKKQFVEYALQKYNNEEGLVGEMRFVFDEIKKEVYVVEGGMQDFYEHFNFTAKQAGSTVLFFAEVVPHEDYCDVLCCKPLDCNDNGHCFACKNQGAENLRHPADEALYVGGHEDCQFPFMRESVSEDDSD